MENEKDDNQIPEDLEKTLSIMEMVETELEAQKRDAIFCFTVFLCATSVWSLLVALWDYLGRPLAGEKMTIGVELIAVIMLVFILKFTKLDIRKMGLSRKNLKASLIRDSIVSVGCVLLLLLVKLVLKKEGSFINWSLFNPWYVGTCFFQEFLARGFLVTTLKNINTTKHSEHVAVICSSLIFASLHSYYGFFFMVGAGILSVILGYIYLKDENIWGVSIIHFCFGMVGIMLELV